MVRNTVIFVDRVVMVFAIFGATRAVPLDVSIAFDRDWRVWPFYEL